jgi:ATP-dependent helicase/nuclease subunit B
VLPGLDNSLDAEGWAEIGPSEREPAGAGHPQYGLQLLLQRLGVTRDDVQEIGVSPARLAGRQRLVSEAMRPAGTTERWTTHPSLDMADKAVALEQISLVETHNEREEALAIATILRGVAESPAKIAALVTPDRGLARRVGVELRRWGINVDDSAGRPLGLTPPGILARLVAEVALRGAAAGTLLAMTKHPLAAFGLAPATARRAARALERAVLRGARLAPGTAALRHAIQAATAARSAPEAERVYPPRAARGLSQLDWDEAVDLADRDGAPAA